MKKVALTTLTILTLLSACNQSSSEGLFETNNANQTMLGTEYDSNNMNRSYGYARHTSEEMERNNNHAGALVFDRDKLAEGISRMVVDIQSVSEAAVLITDKYALAVYKQQDGQPENLVADQVKRTLLASLPSFYEAYVSNDPSHMKDIQRFQNTTAGSQDYKWLIDETIKELKQDPQGDVADQTEDDQTEILNEKQEKLRQEK
ncbi:YhcN/YlaJ family sporulation lipoprotein [Shouchella patagoniensis]|uniref:YhcN/YlaJ family sporulation lipoprotein n=1 Tax=Shouchella patagoniensis TaxID=228576 RepID=UPI0009958FDA|nr:YhcN/YlaJ family sporulation lipoprotein [Shouchella patagoniensis]